MSLEQEIKLAVAGETRLELAQLDWLQTISREQQQQHLRTEYFDTSQMTLKQKGIALRLRRQGEQWLQTVKTSGQVKDGLHQREEWEHPLPAAEFDWSLLLQTPLVEVFAEQDDREQLQCLFYTDFRRDTWLLAAEQNTLIELAYDFGEAGAGERRAKIHEIELELRHGSLAVLRQLAEQLKTTLMLTYNNRSKAEIGYDLYQQGQAL